MSIRTAGMILYRHRDGVPQVLLVHPGGPFWAKKDEGAWSIPKGTCEKGEDLLAAARRELLEETGAEPEGKAVLLGDFRTSSSKVVTAFAMEADFDLAGFRSNTFTMEWPPRSGAMAEFPETDRAGWLGLDAASRKIVKGQLPILAALAAHLAHLGG